MKKQLFALAFIATVGISAAFAGKSSVKTDEVSEYTYYEEGACDVQVTCSDDNNGQLCSEYFENSVLYYQPGCAPIHQVAIPLGKRP
ncbi:hypothetical protein D3C87_1800850 [compost metagenome]